MESINGQHQWALAHSAVDPTTRASILARVQEVLCEMHAAGFVHGDARAGNVLYKVDAENVHSQVMLIDFDSAGYVGTARYSILPFSIAYAPGAEPGGLVKAEHDNWRAETIDRFFA
jgi:serine/threonine protein kinase